MAEAIDILLHNYGVDMLKYAKNKYNYYILTQSLYYCLCGKTMKSLVTFKIFLQHQYKKQFNDFLL